jgi:hypothetical protein
MYADNTLTPKESARLCALGTLADGARTYGELAGSVRHFLDRVQGPILDVMGSSIELLKYEGLVVIQSGEGEQAVLAISDAGRAELETLLTTHVRPGATDLNKLIVSLKFRFLHLLDCLDQASQMDILIDTAETELTRLIDLRDHHGQDEGHLVQWIDMEIDVLRGRIDWLSAFKAKLA